MTLARDAPRPPTYGAPVKWEPATPRLGLVRTIVSWVVAAASVAVAAWLVPGVALEAAGAAFRSPRSSPSSTPCCRRSSRRSGSRSCSRWASCSCSSPTRSCYARRRVLPDDIRVDSFGHALLASLIISAASVVLQTILGTNDDDQYSLRVIRRIAGRQGAVARTDVPGIIFLEIDGLALPVMRDAMRDGARRSWRAGSPTTATGSPSGRRICRRRPAPAKPASCSDPMRTSRRSGGWRRRPASCSSARRRPTARRSSGGTRPASGCSSTAVRAAATCSPARPRRSFSPSAGPRPRSGRTPATGRSWPTASTSRARSCYSRGRSRWS